MANSNPTLYDNFSRVKDWSVEKFVDKEQLAYALSDVAFSGDYNDLINTPDLSTYITKEFLSNQSYVTSSALESMAYATTTYVMEKVNAIIDGAPEALDTLNELAYAINDDANFAGTITTALSNKANSSDVYSKNDINGMSYVSQSVLSSCGYLTSVPSEYITDSELSGMSYIIMDDVSACGYITMSNVSSCGYVTALSQAEMDTLFPITNS